MTATDPRPAPAEKPAARLAPVAPDRGSLSPRRRGGQAPVVEPVLHRLRRHRGPWLDPGFPARRRGQAGAGVTKRGTGHDGSEDKFKAWRERQRQREEREKQEVAGRAHDKT